MNLLFFLRLANNNLANQFVTQITTLLIMADAWGRESNKKVVRLSHNGFPKRTRPPSGVITLHYDDGSKKQLDGKMETFYFLANHHGIEVSGLSQTKYRE